MFVSQETEDENNKFEIDQKDRERRCGLWPLENHKKGKKLTDTDRVTW